MMIIVIQRDDDNLDFQARCAPKLTSDIVQYLKHHAVTMPNHDMMIP